MTARTLRRLAWLSLGLACVACSGRELGSGGAETPVAPAATGSMAPNLAVGSDDTIYLSWVEPRGDGHALRFSTWEQDAWSAPKTIAEGQDWFVNWADFPSMAALDDGTLAAHWLAKSGGATYAYDVRVALSRDGGATWTESFRPHRDETQTEHGFASLVPGEDGFDIVWLDGRETAATPAGAMTLRHAELRADGTLGAESRIDERVCDCCGTDAVRLHDGTVLVAYRDRTESEVRDIAVSSLARGAWSAPRTIHADGWEIGACPVNGPAVAAHGNRVAVAWFSAAADTPAVRLAVSSDAGRVFDPPVRVDLGFPLGRVDVVLLGDDSALVSWIEQTDDRARIYVRRVRSGEALAPLVVATVTSGRASGFPRMVRRGDDVVLAWTDAGPPSSIVTAVLPIPRESGS